MAIARDDAKLGRKSSSIEGLAAQAIKEVVQAEKPSFKKKSSLAKKARPVLGIVSFVVLIAQAPPLMQAFQDAQPIRIGTYDTDAQTDLCIHNLWSISSHFQGSSGLDMDISEPISNAPYTIETHNGEMIVACPNPAAHGLRSLQVRESVPVPEVR